MYGSRARADTYIGAGLKADEWEELADDVKDSYLVSAFRWLKSSFELLLPEPKEDSDDDKDILVYAQAEAAMFLIEYGQEYFDRSAVISSGVEIATVADRREAFAKSPRIPFHIINMLQDYISYKTVVSLV